MADNTHELAPDHLPGFIPSMDGSDPLMMIMLAAIIIGIVLLGTFYLYLHSLPERLAHKNDRMQFELVAVLGLLALFTHNNIFWVAALLLAFIRLPDFGTPLATIANSLSRMANWYDVPSSTAPEPLVEASEPDSMEDETDKAASADEPITASRQTAEKQEG